MIKKAICLVLGHKPALDRIEKGNRKYHMCWRCGEHIESTTCIRCSKPEPEDARHTYTEHGYVCNSCEQEF